MDSHVLEPGEVMSQNSSEGVVDEDLFIGRDTLLHGRTNSIQSQTSLDPHNPAEKANSEIQKQLGEQRIDAWSSGVKIGDKIPRSSQRSQRLGSPRPYQNLSVIDPSTLSRTIKKLEGVPITPITPNTNRVITQIMENFPKSQFYFLRSLNITCSDISNRTRLLKNYLISSIYWALEAANIGVNKMSKPPDIVTQVLLGHSEFDKVVADQIKECKRSQIASTSLSIEQVIKSLKEAIKNAITQSMNQDSHDIKDTIQRIGIQAIERINDERISIEDRIEIGKNAFSEITQLAQSVATERIGGKSHRRKRSKRRTKRTKRSRKTKRRRTRTRTRRRKV